MLIQIHLTPNASCDRIIGLTKNAQGQDMLKVKVTAIPEDGKANKMLIRLLAKKLKIAPSSIKIIKGMTARHKTVEIHHWEGNLQDIFELKVS